MKLIKINTDHYIIVDDSEIKEKSGDWFYSFETGKIYDTLIHHTAASCKKITHSTQPLELLSENELSGMGFSKVRPLNIFEVKELIGEVDVDKRVDDYGFQVPYDGSNKFYDEEKMKHYKAGYLQAIEDNKDKKYTEEDVIAIVEKSRATGLTAEYIIQSLQPKTEWDVEIIDNKLKLK